MIITITNREEKTISKGANAGKTFLQLTDENGKKHNIFGLTAQWPICLVGYQIELGYQDDDRTKNVEYIRPGQSMPESVKPEVVESTMPPQEEIEQAKASQVTPAPQAVGMVTKEIGDMIRSKYLKPIFGDDAYLELIKWYRSQVLGITRINFDGAKLPDFKTKENK